MDNRFKQAHREAKWALGLTMIYLLGWILLAYCSPLTIGITGFPHWFELACLILPLFFMLLCWGTVHFFFKDISLEKDHAD